MVSHMGQTRTSGVLVKLHSRHDQLLYVPSLAVEVSADTFAVAKEATATIVDVAKEEAVAEIVDVARAGAMAVSARFYVEKVVVAVPVEEAALVALTVAMVGVVAVSAVIMMTVDASAAILEGK